jgi:transcriptional regulator with XRE-family HTH domain
MWPALAAPGSDEVALAKNQKLIDAKYTYRLRLLRAIYDETQQEFADRLGIKFKTWNEYERGYVLPTTTLLLIRKHIEPGIIEWLLTGDRKLITMNFDALLEKALQRVREQDKAKAKAQRLKQRVVADYIRKRKAENLAAGE